MRFALIQDGVECYIGFRVIHLNCHTIRYEENHRALTIAVEQHLDRSIDVYLREAVRWASPYEKERLDATRRQVIRYRVEAALIFEGYSPHFDGSDMFAHEGAWSVSGIDANLAIG